MLRLLKTDRSGSQQKDKQVMVSTVSCGGGADEPPKSQPKGNFYGCLVGILVFLAYLICLFFCLGLVIKAFKFFLEQLGV